MKKLLIVASLFPNAMEPTKGVFLKQMVSHLRGCFDVSVISPLPWGLKMGLKRQDIIEGISVDYPRYFMIPKMMRSLYGLLYGISLFPSVWKMSKRFSWDAIIVTWAYPDAFGMMLINHFMKRPFFVYVLGSDINIYTKFFLRRKMIVYTLKNATRVFSVAEQLREKAISLGVNPDQIVVIPTGIDTRLFYPMDKNKCRQQLKLPTDKKIILFVGGLCLVKGLEYFIEAALLLIKKRDDLLFLMIGEGDQRNLLQTIITNENRGDAIRLLGIKPHDQISSWMNSCDLFCLPSISEGCPNVVMEALACGRPVVGTDVGDVSRLILRKPGGGEGGGGAVVPPRDSQALADAIVSVLDKIWDPQMLSQSIQEYTWESTTQKVHQEIMRHLSPE
ncbi:MAG: glycosyltransferase family 4 protein [Nitrospirota bacterium]